MITWSGMKKVMADKSKTPPPMPIMAEIMEVKNVTIVRMASVIGQI